MDIVDQIDQILHCNSEGGEPAEVTNWEYEDGDSDPLEAFDGEYDYIDAQLAQGPKDDYNADRYDKCWHCGDDYHGLPITEAMRHLRHYGHYRTENDFEGRRISNVDELLEHGDTSPVICHGSEFIGPQPCSMTPPEYQWAARYIDQIQYVRMTETSYRIDDDAEQINRSALTAQEIATLYGVNPALMEPWTQLALNNNGPTWQEVLEGAVLEVGANLWFPNDEDPTQTCVVMAGDDEDVA